MQPKSFLKLFYVMLGLGLIITVAHAAYALYAYDNSSIIHFVSKELW